MSRRILSIVLVIALLAFSWLLTANNKVKALTATPSAIFTPTQPHDYVSLPSSGPAPLTVQFVNTGSTAPNQIAICSWSFTDGGAGGMVGFYAGPGNYYASCPTTSHIFPNGGSFTTTLNLVGVPNSGGTLIKVGDVNVPGPTATFAPLVGTTPDLIMKSIGYANPTCANPAGTISVGIINGGGGGAAGPFVVSYGSQTQTVSGLDFTKEASVSFTLEGSGWVKPVVDSTNAVTEINEANNSWAAWVPTPAPAPTCTPATPVTVTQTPTRTNTPGITNTLTRTPTRMNTGTITRTPTLGASPTAGPSLTPTRTLTPTTVVGDFCSPVSYTITAPFTFDGAGSFCWQTSALGSYINSWNTSSVTINTVNITNVYVPAASYPAKIGGFYYVSYNSSVAWGHFETK